MAGFPSRDTILSFMTAEYPSLGGGGPFGGQRKSAAGGNNFLSFSIHMGSSLKETQSEETPPETSQHPVSVPAAGCPLCG